MEKKEFTVVGKRQIDPDAIAKATGAAKFTADIILPGMLHGKILRSPHPHARIVHIDTRMAQKLQGVRAVLTGQDIPRVKYGIVPETRDQYMLAVDKVRYIGEEVAAVAAVDEATALAALKLIKVEYEVLPAVFEPMEALLEGAPQLHEEWPGNVAINVDINYGDLDAGFRQADYVREDRFVTDAITHAMLEPYAVLCIWDAIGKVDIWMPNQSPFTKRRALSRALGLPMDDIRVRRAFIGGGFGGRSELFPADVCAAFLSRKTGRPVKITYTREEMFYCSRQKHPFIVDIKTGVKKDGTITAKEFRIIADGGAYQSTGSIALSNPPAMYLGLINVPNFSYQAKRVYTNKPVRGAMKGHGNQQMRFADGCQMNMIAEELGIDPADMLLKNSLRTGDTTLNGAKVNSCGLPETMEHVLKGIGWNWQPKTQSQQAGTKNNLPAEPQGNIARGKGIGYASMINGFYLGVRTAGSGIVKFNEDGGATIFTGSTDNGQGNHNMMRIITAEELGIPLASVSVIAADTEITPQDPGSYTMSATYVSANGTKAAAADAKLQLLEVAGEMLEVKPEELCTGDGLVWAPKEPSKALQIKQVVWQAFKTGKPIIGRGYWKPEVTEADWVHGKIDGQVTGTYSYGSVGVELEVNKETGRVKVLKVVAAHDCGRALNPMAVEGQIQGSVGFGLGEALAEHIDFDGGMVLNPSFMDYGMLLSSDIPEVESIIVESIDPHGPFGAKEAAETIDIAILPAIAEAIYNAVGVWVKQLPITPELILEGLAAQEAAAGERGE